MIHKKYFKTKAVCKLSFSLSAEQFGEKADVRVLGQFNDWNWGKGLVLKAKKDNYVGSLELAAGNAYEFRYLVNGEQWLNDEAADNYIPTPYFSHNSVAVLDAVEIKTPVKKKATAKTAKVKTNTKKAKTDDLRKIEGIGPKIAGLLKEDGIQSFADLAKAKQPKLKAVLAAAGSRFKMHQPTTWPKQAKLAAAGKWEALAKLQEELKGGVKQ